MESYFKLFHAILDLIKINFVTFKFSNAIYLHAWAIICSKCLWFNKWSAQYLSVDSSPFRNNLKAIKIQKQKSGQIILLKVLAQKYKNINISTKIHPTENRSKTFDKGLAGFCHSANHKRLYYNPFTYLDTLKWVSCENNFDKFQVLNLNRKN